MTANNLINLNSICDAVVRILFLVEKRHPNWLKEQFRSYPWQDPSFQNKFKQKLQNKFKNIKNPDNLIEKLIDLLSYLVYPIFFKSFYFRELMHNVTNYSFTNNHQQEIDFYLAILLLDTENLYLDINSEKFLKQVSNYPIKLKFAFGNWRNLGKKDLEFYERGYELLHVPPGKNSADLKMISFGSSIWLNYPNAKEVFICSSDGDLNHLSTALQHHGITVYKVSRRGNDLIVINSQTSQLQKFSLAQTTEFPSFIDCINKIKNLIVMEQKRTGKTWIKLTQILQMFKKNTNLNLPEIITYYFPEQAIEKVLVQSSNGIVIYRQHEDNQLYLTIFTQPTEEIIPEKESIKIDSAVDLEQALRKIIHKLIQESDQEYVNIIQVATEFKTKYHISINQTIEKLKLGKKFAKLIDSYESLELIKKDNVYYVAIV
jgi:hypothetical protein